MKCKKCENITTDSTTGITVCLDCGNVIEESNIISQLDFDRNKNVNGTLVNLTFKNDSLFSFDPIQAKRNKVYNYMSSIASSLSIPLHILEKAKKLYLIACNKKITKGRTTKIFVGALLYLSCRLCGSKHLLIDFSEVLQVNLFVIGVTYLKITKYLKMQVNIIDPSFYMVRFCNQFNFGDKSQEILKFSYKILKFFQRDWITTGRRPSSVCGASLLIAAKLNGINITVNDVINVVKCSKDTLTKRLKEFSQTKASEMTKEDLVNFTNFENYKGMNPPSFSNSISLNEEDNNLKEELNLKIIDEDNKINFYKEIDDTKNENLSLLGANEEDLYICNNLEYQIKKRIWEIMNKDWLNEQREKKEKMQFLERKKIYRPRKSTTSNITTQTPYEAIKKSSKFPRKMNLQLLKTLFDNNNQHSFKL